MSLTRNHAVGLPYTKGSAPKDKERLDLHIHDELRRIEASMKRAVLLLPQAAAAEPAEKLIGMQRYAIAASWDPLSSGTDSWVYWDGAAWSPL